MCRLLLGLVPILIIAPHLIPLPDKPVPDDKDHSNISDFKDDGKSLPSRAQMDTLAKNDPISFLKYCLRRQEREVSSYSLTLQKQERINGKLEKKEIIEVHFKEKPHSVFFQWKSGQRLAQRALYVTGENNGMLVVKPAGIGGAFLKSVERDPEGKDARSSGRYTLKEFGLQLGLRHTLGTWEKAKEQKALHVEYLGKQKIKELERRECYVFKRSRFKEPEGDGVTEQMAYVDAETWLLTGSILRGGEEGAKDRPLIAEYYFRDIRLNPKFKEDQFTRKAIEEK
jgi:hypothetical protein